MPSGVAGPSGTNTGLGPPEKGGGMAQAGFSSLTLARAASLSWYHCALSSV
jgi:hypothetical protein